MRGVSIVPVTAVLVLVVILVACSGDGGGAETKPGAGTPSTSLVATTTTAVAASTTGVATTATTAATEATTDTTEAAVATRTTAAAAATTSGAGPGVFYAIDWAHPMAPDPLPGSGGALGSGCTPGSDRLDDGIWVGWIINRSSSSFDFDLACLGEEPDGFGLSNQSTRLRTVAANAATVVYPVATDGGTGPPTPYPDARPSPWCGPGFISPSLPDGCPVWVYLNGGVATEIFEFWIP